MTTRGTDGAGAAPALRVLRKIAIAIVGVTVLAAGIALIVLPGPAFLVIPAGLAILATEFVWAARLLKRGKERAARLLRRVRAPVPTE